MRFVRETDRFVVTFVQERRNNREWTVRHEEARVLFGGHVPLFVKSGLWDTMSVAVACRLGLRKSTENERSHELVCSSDWNISRIWFSDGSRHEEKGAYYATETGAERKGRINLYTFRSTRATLQESGVEWYNEVADKAEFLWSGREGKVANISKLTPSIRNFQVEAL